MNEDGGKAGGEFENSFEKEEILKIAEAITARQLQEANTFQVLASEVTGFEVPEYSEVIRDKLMVGAVAFQVKRIENPETSLSIIDFFDSLGDEFYKEVADQASEGEYEKVSPEEIKELIIDMNSPLVTELEIDYEETATEFARTFQAAKEVAKENNASVASVFSDEELYAALHRKAFMPAEYVQTQSRFLEKVTEETVRAIISQMLRIEFGKEDPNDFSQSEIDEIILGIEDDYEIQSVISEAVAKFQTGVKHVIVANIIRFWGEEVLHDLPVATQEQLDLEDSPLYSGRQPRNVNVGGFAILGASNEQANALLMREAFVKTYFEERGWDINDPTVEQILEVRSQPGWQNPTV